MNWKRFMVVAFALLVALSIGSGRLAAQTSTTGDVTGIVTDPSNAIVPDAKVALKNESRGDVQETKTSKDGIYRFFLLAPGPYTVSVTAAGFDTVSRRVEVPVGQVATINITLAVGTSSTTVTVTEAAPLLQTDNGDTATAITEQQVSQVPNPGNDLSYVAQLAPGTVMNTQGGYGNVEAFGLPATSNLFTVNGMDDNDPFLNLNNSGATNLLLGSNEMQEVDVVTNGYSGAYGTFAGINVNYVTKSGGNDFHGNADHACRRRIEAFQQREPVGRVTRRAHQEGQAVLLPQYGRASRFDSCSADHHDSDIGLRGSHTQQPHGPGSHRLDSVLLQPERHANEPHARELYLPGGGGRFRRWNI